MATQNIFDLTDTWNNVATTFTAIKMNATDTASAAGSLLLDVQLSTVSKFKVGKQAATFAQNVIFGTDNTYDIGASGATRPRTIYVATGIITGGTITGGAFNAGNAGLFYFGSRTQMQSPADGVLSLYNSTGADFTRLQLGGTSNSFGAIARDGAGISIVGSAGGSTAHIKVPGVTVANLPAAATAGAGARSFVTDALAPVFGSAVAGSGAVKVPVYSDGSAWNVG